MLVPVEFPSDLVVADFVEIKKSDFVPGLQWSALAVHGVEVPIDFCAIIQIAISQQTEPVLQNLVRFSNCFFDGRR